MGARIVLSKSEGAIVIIVVILMIVLLSCGALAIDMSLALITRNQLYNLADGAALAGTRVLGQKYAAMPTYAGYTLTSQDIQDITDAVTQVAANNIAGGKSPITINGGDIRIGRWDSSTRTLTVTNTEATAVEVTARRDTTANGPISTFFANVMGINGLSVISVAERQGGMWTGQENPTAALTGVGKVDPQTLTIPIGISAARFNSPYCADPIIFYPTNDPSSCGGLTTFSSTGNPSASDIRQVIDQIFHDNNPAPGVQAGTTYFQFTGGTQASLMCPGPNPQGDTFQELYNKFQVGGVWETLVPVYDSASCSNPNVNSKILGFATVHVTGITCPNGPVQGTVECQFVKPQTRGGGVNYGTLGEVPNLVK